jgi:hypothetical protein
MWDLHEIYYACESYIYIYIYIYIYVCMYVCVSFSVLAEHQAKEFVFYYACETCMRFIMHVKVIEYKIKRNVCFYSLTITIYLLTPPSKYIYIYKLFKLWLSCLNLLFVVYTIYVHNLAVWRIYLLHCTFIDYISS